MGNLLARYGRWRLLMESLQLGVFACAMAVMPAFADEPALDKAADRRPLVVTRGEGLVRTAPDRAFVVLAAEARDGSPKVALARNAEAMDGVQKKLGEAGIVKDAIRTLGHELNQEFDYVNGKQVSRGYLARSSVEVRVDAVERVGELIDRVVAGGATSVGNVRFDLKDRSALEREALRLAVADARGRAEAAALGAGTGLEEIVRIEEESSGGLDDPHPKMMRQAAVAMDAAAPGTSISPGEITIRSSVRLTMTLRAKPAP